MSEQAPQGPENPAGEEPKDDESITKAPLHIPQANRPAGSDMWASAADNERSDEPSGPTVVSEPEFSPQSQRAIRAIEEGLAEESCTQIDGYGPSRFSAQVNGQNMLMENIAFSSVEEYERWLRKLVQESNSVVSWDKIQTDRMGVLELNDGSRLAVFLPPVARPNPTFSLRKHTAAKWQPTQLIENHTMDERMLKFLQACVAAHVNILFVGAMGAGKSTLMRSLLQGIGDNERLAVVEQVPELAIKKPLVVEYLYQPTIEGFGLHDVLDFNLYNGLDRLVVGEVHLEGITKMLETMILTEGSMSTYHAYSTEQAGERMKLALQLENQNVSAATAVSFIRQAIELVVVMQKLSNGRKVTQITEIDWRSSAGRENLGGSDIFVYDKANDRFKASNPPNLGRIEAKMLKYGVRIVDDWFFEAEDLVRFKRNAGLSN